MSLNWRQLVPVRSLGYRTDVIDIAIEAGTQEYVKDVVGDYGAVASELTFLNRSDAVVYIQVGPDAPEFGIPEQTAFTRDEAWISWFKLRAPGGIGAGSDLALTIAPLQEVRIG